MKANLRLLIVCGLIAFGLQGYAQDRTVSGKVTSIDDGSAIPGVNVIVKGTTNGTVTDVDGNYKITLTSDGGTLVFSFIGYETAEIEIGTRSVIDLQMSIDATELSEVVVIGYGTSQKKDLTGSVASVRSDEIQNIPVIGIDQAIQGKAAGVNVISANGQPGGNVSLRVRGSTSIQASNEPLYVIDGIPVVNQALFQGGQFGGLGGQTSNSISDLNWSDVESIEILKDASAAAIYGSRASNGVVLITTKRGKRGQKATLSLNYYRGQTEVFELPDMLNSAQYIELQNEARVNAGLTARPLTFFEDPNNPGVTPDTDWMDIIFRTAAVQQFDASVRGGGEATAYFASFTVNDQEGTLRGTGFTRLSGRINLDSKVNDWLSFGSNVAISYTDGALQANDNFIIGPYFSALRTAPYFTPQQPGGAFTVTNQFDNPLAATQYQNNNQTYRILASGFFEIEPISNLKIRSSLSLDYNNFQQDQFWPTTVLGGRLTGSGWSQQGFNQQRNVIWENTVSYLKEINDRHSVTGLVGASWQEDRRYSVLSTATNFPNDQLRTLNSAATPLQTTGARTANGLNSFFGRVNYNFDDRVLVTGTVRADGSSRFAEDERYGVFPSIAVAWRVSNEAFASGLSFLDDLKIRASYGATGNQQFGNFASRGLFQGGFVYNGVSGIAPSQIANDQLKWENTVTLDIGFDFTLLNSRINGSFDWYSSQTDDLLLNAPLPPNSGFTTVTRNIGEIENTGIEVTLGADIIRTSDFTWNITGNIAANRNEVKKLVDGSDINATGFGQSIIREGETLNSFFGHQVVGIFQTAQDVSDAPTQTAGTAPGDFQFLDADGDGAITNADRVILGTAQPDFLGGFTNSINYKGLELIAFFQYSIGNEILNMNLRDGVLSMRNADNVQTAALNRWTPTNTNTDIPRMVIGDPNQNRRFNSAMVEDGSFLRMKTLTLAYNLPSSLLNSIYDGFLSNVRIYAQATNLLTITDYSGVDPEVSTFVNTSSGNGVDNNTYPGGKTYTLGINVSF